jgi:hypothetical protein
MSKQDLKEFLGLVASVLILAGFFGLVALAVSIDWKLTLKKVGIELRQGQ